MKILAFDTATNLTTAAIMIDGKIAAQVSHEGAMSHAELLGPAIEQVLDSAGLDINQVTDLAVGVGPGPYTGLRVGVVTALTLADTLGVPAHGVCTLDILAAEIDEEEFYVMTDARRKEVYWAHYRNGIRLDGPKVDRGENIELGACPAYGRGALMYGLNSASNHLDPDAATLARIVCEQSVEILALEPLYLRRPDVTMRNQSKQA